MLTATEFFAGWFAGLCGLAAGHPLDTLKVRQQNVDMKLPSIFLNTLKQEGVKGFYKGMKFPLLAAGTYNAVLFGVFSNSQRYLQLSKSVSENRFCKERGERYKGWHTDVFIAGSLSGLVSVFFGCPIEHIKTRLQMQTGMFWSGQKFEGTWDCAKQIYRTGGLRLLYRGFIPMLIRDIPSFGLYMLMYEHFIGMSHGPIARVRDLTTKDKVLAGGLAGVFSWIPAIPFDVIKTRMQSEDLSKASYKGMIDCTKKMYQLYGFEVFIRGLGLSFFRTFPKNAATFYGYELFLKLF